MTRVGTEEDRPGEELLGLTASGCYRAGSSQGVGARRLQNPSLPSRGCIWVCLASCNSHLQGWASPVVPNQPLCSSVSGGLLMGVFALDPTGFLWIPITTSRNGEVEVPAFPG